MKRRKANYLYSILGVALVLFLVGLCGSVLLYIKQLMQNEQEQLTLMVELKNDADTLEIANLKNFLQSDNVLTTVGSLKFVSKEEAFENMSRQFPEEAKLLKDGPVPNFNSFILNFSGNAMNEQQWDALQIKIKAFPSVSDVYLDKSVLSELSENIYKITLVALFLAFAFVIVSITLIHNTIRLNLYSDRFLIKNMELVGASWSFITKPYLQRSIVNGLISSLLALMILLGIGWFSKNKFSFTNLQLINSETLVLFVGVVVLGVVISFLSTVYVVNKYLKMRLDDLY